MRGLPGLNQYLKHGLMCLAQGHNAVTPVRFEPATPLSLVKLSTTEPQCAPYKWTSKTYEHFGKAGGINPQNMFTKNLKRGF